VKPFFGGTDGWFFQVYIIRIYETMAERFKFPFQPYKIQEEFMENLYKTIDEEKIGIFESPTGTVR